MDILLAIHSLFRWFIVALAALTIFKFAVAWAGNASFKGMDRGLASALSGLMDAQVLLGLVYFLWSGFAGEGFPAARWIHALVMLAASALMHVPARLKALGDKQRFVYSILSLFGALGLVFVGLAAL